ncbi:uncharacterized protein Z519_11004 [Cladophialophora bantiana CBS 173.52]|uniref:Uncharacterized protein n=1 Tax=Cladophialophora bantiana (strain ATCC 10958 / CBS 173.52 / CDC B-1940 / NIH 8579) TaxID=1442370 RepID=A0A0D2HBZ0_CLAB1|nr:uncharacterized protein Z519_11004 [Cladophialophora bantiana CBS 173.52]KIW88435.1 hypothetical protein Z519_11004 [Cladophialophora bantiana CBS 173.52]
MISDQAIIVICIFSAAAVVTMGYAVHRIFSKASYVGHNFTLPDSQRQYMRELRERNIMDAFGDPGQQPRHHHHPTDM